MGYPYWHYTTVGLWSLKFWLSIFPLHLTSRLALLRKSLQKVWKSQHKNFNKNENHVLHLQNQRSLIKIDLKSNKKCNYLRKSRSIAFLYGASPKKLKLFTNKILLSLTPFFKRIFWLFWFFKLKEVVTSFWIFCELLLYFTIFPFLKYCVIISSSSSSLDTFI